MSDDILYHYCSIDSFVAIMQSRSLWLSDITKSNDSAELSWFLKQFREYAIGRIDEQYKCSQQEAFEYQISTLNNGNLEDTSSINHPYRIKRDKAFLISSLTDSVYAEGKIFAFCLSECSDLLSQWRGYANDGTGVSIGFNKAALLNYISKLPNSKYIDLNKISYDNTSLSSAMQTLFDSIDRLPLNSILQSLALCMPVAACYKNPSFSEEQEWRIILNAPSLWLNLQDNAFDPLSRRVELNNINREFRTNGARVIEYQRLKFNNFSGLIDHVIIGPKSRVSEYDIKTLLYIATTFEETNNKIKISSSSSTYR